ncbi:hypothetical protein M3Y98_00142200 [Aphelenchoides besseyi]|nr:hypothetical protein M3Y98_00142200 [Aphelenchoides besseyi]KAI6199713.1 hypothetical protein M3Y96_00656000 [Aphelenchoides besseyi]
MPKIEDELRRKINKLYLEEDINHAALAEAYVELGELTKRSDSDVALDCYGKAIEHASKCASYLDWTLAHRNAGEIYIQRNEINEAFKHFNKQHKVAKESGIEDYIQLALHTLASNYMDEAIAAKELDRGKELEYIIKSLKYARNCSSYLKDNEDKIKEHAAKTDFGEGPNRRRAGIQLVLARIYYNLGYKSDAKRCFNEVNHYIIYMNCKKTEYEFYNAYMDNWVDTLSGPEKLKQIEDLIPNLKKEKHREKITIFETQLNILNITYSTKKEVLSSAIGYFIKKLYMFIKLDTNLEAAKTSKEKLIVYERIADKAVDAGFDELAIRYYEEMSKYAKCCGNKEKEYAAYTSISETAVDKMCDYERAVKEKSKCIDLVSVAYPNSHHKKFMDEFDLFVYKCKLDTRNKEMQQGRFMEYISQSNGKQKAAILREYILFLAYHGCGNEEFKKRQQQLELAQTENDENDSLDEDADEENYKLELTVDEMVIELNSFCNNINNALKDDPEERNNVGETKLHLAAKVDDARELERLVRGPYKGIVSEPDNGGWTPLHEAVNCGYLDNVRILLLNGAKVNCQSTEGHVDDNDVLGPKGITPLMDAISNGHFEIANLLINRFQANVLLENSMGQTAIDILKDYLSGHVQDERYKKGMDLLKDMEKHAAKRPRYSDI